MFKIKKIKFIKIREPGGNNNSEKIRSLILNKKNKFNSFTDLMLYFAARSENVEKIIKKNYQKKVILLDRFSDSTCYQHYKGLKHFFNKEKKLKLILKNIEPIKVFLNTVNMRNLSKKT